MKKLIKFSILIICLIGLSLSLESPKNLSFNETEIILLNKEYAKFQEAYKIIRKWEGNYSYSLHDKGGETYAGITKRYNKEWEGWKIIDKIPNKTWNQEIPEVEHLVKDHYLSIFANEKFYLIKNQKIANYIFDFRINSRKAIKIIQRTLCIEESSKLDINTFNTINNTNPEELLIRLEFARIDYLKSLTSKDATQKKWLKGWLKRANI